MDDCWFLGIWTSTGIGIAVGLSVMVIVLAVLASILIFKVKQRNTAAQRKQESDFTELTTTSTFNEPATYATVTEVGNQPPIQPENPTYDDIGSRISDEYEIVDSGEQTVSSYEILSRDRGNQEHVYVKPRAGI